MWEGCRNYVVRNYIRDEMRIGDLAFFWHSNVSPPGVVGIMKVVSEPYPDPTQWDPSSHYFDEKSKKDQPRWFVRDMQFVKKFAGTVSLAVLKETPGLEDLAVTKKGNRLSICRVSPAEWDIILAMAERL